MASAGNVGAGWSSVDQASPSVLITHTKSKSNSVEPIYTLLLIKYINAHIFLM